MRNWIAATLICVGAPAWGQSLVEAGSDTIELRPATPDCQCVGWLHYSNGESQGSKPGYYTVERGGIAVDVRISVGDEETLFIYAYETGFMVLLDGEIVEEVEVPDGGSIVLRVLPPMF